MQCNINLKEYDLNIYFSKNFKNQDLKNYKIYLILAQSLYLNLQEDNELDESKAN